MKAACALVTSAADLKICISLQGLPPDAKQVCDNKGWCGFHCSSNRCQASLKGIRSPKADPHATRSATRADNHHTAEMLYSFTYRVCKMLQAIASMLLLPGLPTLIPDGLSRKCSL